MTADSMAEAARGLQAAIVTTENMLEAAEAGEWESVDRLAQARRGQLAPLNAAGAALGQGDALARLAALNERLTDLAAEHRDALGARTRSLRRGARAAQAYGAAGR